MSQPNQYASNNKAWWEKMVAESCGFTRPWLDLDPELVRQQARCPAANPPKPLDQIYPAAVLSGIENKDVLCLASGGGQQSAVFGLLGAKVTVVDFSEGQLQGDRAAAEHYGYAVTTIQADISDLSPLATNAFDLVYQPSSMAYLPDLKAVYREVARALRPGGVYRADAQNPVSQFVDEKTWDGKGYRISLPYAVKEKARSDEPGAVVEFRHGLDETFNGLIECGFVIEQVVEEPAGIFTDGEPEPGSWAHSLRYLPGGFAILARKK
jgi:SAM-dependent methyltransferase